ncbi:Suppressor of the cold-sensitive snRNP bioproteinsis mutant brr1-1 [Perkinsus chesapeaki]|uniref:subtilisin n=1 Tax=Perkinsus chesapeaki TaxID=330153 RepID=A0A7J6LVQ6_PERCH|nr:Suppressor of the cold-sensitive snRNP bioproteinsis mutant brr1-1 [Perkinsus chesapeaki]
MPFTRFLSALLPICYAAPIEVYDDRTILSIFSGGSPVGVVNIPALLAVTGVLGNIGIATFLSTTPVKTIKFAQCQAVPTSTDSVSNAALCEYLYEAQKHLPHLVVTCGRNVMGELTQPTDMPDNDDPDAHRQTYLDRMNLTSVWQTINEYPRKNVTVAVLDQGVNFTDPDMAPLKIAFITGDGTAINGGWNFVDDSAILTAMEYHGQFVSRIIAARGNNSFGVIGVAPSHIHLVSLQVCGLPRCPIINVIEAFDMAMDIGVDVISISFSYSEYPCWYGGPNAMCVAALSDSPNYQLAGFSNYGHRVDIAAFGEYIYVGIDEHGDPALVSGTSYSTPMVSGAVAILLSLGG